MSNSEMRPISDCAECNAALWRAATGSEIDEMERETGFRDWEEAALWVCAFCGNWCMVAVEIGSGTFLDHS